MKREEASRRRLELARLLRDDPKATNIALAKALNVNRDTIAEDRKAIMELVKNDTKTETELLREEMVQELEGLKAEVEKHRKDGKLSLQAVDRMLDITKAIIELTGVRKPVNEKVDHTHKAPIRFQTVIVSTDGKERPVLDAEVIKEPYALEAGHESR
jgi:hypothetical protein